MNFKEWFHEHKLAILIGLVIAFNTAMLIGQSIRLDESQQIWISTKPVATIIKLIGEDVHVPLYAILLHFWLQIFGANIVMARIMSLVFFALTLGAIYVFASESGGKRTALLTLALFTFSPFIAWFSNETRMYTLFLFATSLSHLYFMRFLRSGGESGKSGYLMSTILGLYSHYFFVLLVFIQFVVVLNRAVMKKTYAILWRHLIIISVAGVVFAPWLWYVVGLGGASNTQPLIPQPTSYNIFQTFVLFLFGFQADSLQSLFVSMWPLSVGLVFLVFTQRKRAVIEAGDYFATATFLPIILIFAISFFRPIFLARYMIFTLPSLFFLIASLINNYPARVSKRLKIGLLGTMLILLAYQNVSAQVPVKENYEGVSQYLSGNVSPRDVVVTSPPFTIYPIEFMYTGKARIDTIPEWNRFETGGIPAFDREKFVKQIERYKSIYVRIFMVLSYDQGYESEIRSYMDSNFQLIKSEQFSPGVELRVYQLRYGIDF